MTFHVDVTESNRYFLLSTLEFDLESKVILIRKEELYNLVLDAIRRFDFSLEDMQYLLNDIKNEISKRK